MAGLWGDEDTVKRDERDCRRSIGEWGPEAKEGRGSTEKNTQLVSGQVRGGRAVPIGPGK